MSQNLHFYMKSIGQDGCAQGMMIMMAVTRTTKREYNRLFFTKHKVGQKHGLDGYPQFLYEKREIK